MKPFDGSDYFAPKVKADAKKGKKFLLFIITIKNHLRKGRTTI
jgi:hypothetical protein